MLLLVNPHEKQKKKYSINKKINKFDNQLDLTLKEIDIKDKATETAKDKERNKNSKTKSILKMPGNKKNYIDDMHKELEILI